MKHKLHTLVLLLSLLAALQSADGESFEVDRTHSAIGFSIRHLISTVHGRFTNFSGTVEYDPADISKFSVDVTVQDSSINTDHQRRDQHLRSQDFFWTDSFPTLRFKSVKAYERDKQYYVEGDFTMRGVTKYVIIPFEVVGMLGSGENAVLGLHATFVIDRTEYGIQWNNPLEAGGFVLGNDVTINIDIEARKPRPPR